MHLALSTEVFGRMDRTLESAVRFGFRFIEMWVDQHRPLAAAQEDFREMTKRGLQACCVGAADFGTGHRGQEVACLKDTIAFAADVGAKIVCCYWFHELILDEAARDQVDSVLDFAEGKGVEVVIENEVSVGATERADIETVQGNLRLAERVGRDNFGLNFDACNFYVVGDEPFPYGYRLLKPHIKYVHLKAAVQHTEALYPSKKGMRTFHPDFCFTPLDVCGYNISGLLDAMVEDQYAGFVTLEPEVIILKETDKIADNLDRSLRFLNRWKISV